MRRSNFGLSDWEFPENEKWKSYELQGLKMQQAVKTAHNMAFLMQSCLCVYRSVLLINIYHTLTLPGSFYILYGDSLKGTLHDFYRKNMDFYFKYPQQS